ncbi:MAG: hypothetical protein IPL40_16380 [Proteobacteria bacterium]|nr:hypothetical protein [Pseudomonadota bacterium]
MRTAPPPPSASRPLWGAWVVSLLAGLLALTLARFLEGPGWVVALWALGASLGVATALALGLALRSWAPAAWSCWAALLLAGGAALGRATALMAARGTATSPPAIDWQRVTVASGSVAWALLALLWGTHGLAQQVETTVARGVRGWLATIAAAAAIVLALHSAAPFWRLIGLDVNLFTVLGLFGLAATAYALEAAYRWLRRR